MAATVSVQADNAIADYLVHLMAMSLILNSVEFVSVYL
jgi:hypothetical protein